MSTAASNLDTKFYRKSPKGRRGTVDLDDETARVFAVIDEKTHLSRVAELAEVSTAVLWKAVAKLSRLGLIEDAEGAAGGFMGRLFTDALQAELTRAVGPISQILLKNVSEQMDIAFPNVPVDRVRELVYKLAERIPDEKTGAEFQHNMFKDL